MPARESAEVKLALRLVSEGKSRYEAAQLAGVAASSVYRALKRQAKKTRRKG